MQRYCSSHSFSTLHTPLTILFFSSTISTFQHSKPFPSNIILCPPSITSIFPPDAPITLYFAFSTQKGRLHPLPPYRMSIGGFHFQSAELPFNHQDFQCKTVAINFYPREINVVDKNALSEKYFGQEVMSCFDYLIRIQACNNCPPLMKTLKFGLKT